MKKLFIVLSVACGITCGTARAYTSYTQNETSFVGVIIVDSIKQFGMNLATIEDRIYVLFGNDRARDALDAKLHDISYVASRAADTETLTHKITTGILWILLLSLIVFPIFVICKKKQK